MSKSLSNDVLLSTQKKENSALTPYKRPIFVALAIIALIGVTIGAIGFLSFGGYQSWWSPLLNQITEGQTIIMMGTGGSAFLICIIAAAALNKILKTAPEQTTNQNLSSNLNVTQISKNPQETEQLVTTDQKARSENVQPAPDGLPITQQSKEADPLPVSPIRKAHELFSYPQLAEQKYRTVLEEYVRHLTQKTLSFMQQKVKGLLRCEADNTMLLELQKLVTLLDGPWENPSRNYHEAILALRNVIESSEYQMMSGRVLDEKSDHYKIRSFVRRLCLIRWSDTHLYSYLEDIVHLTTGEDQLPPFNLENFSETVRQVNQQVEDSVVNKKSRAALAKQKLSGALGLEDYCGNQNPPHVRLTQVYQDRDGHTLPIAYVRHGSPTALGTDYYKIGIAARKVVAPVTRLFGFDIGTGEEVTSDYKEYLKALEENGKGELFCIHQRRSPNVIENERERVLRIEELQKTHPNLFVLVQPVEGDLFNRQGAYVNIYTFEDLKKELVKEFFDHPHSTTALPNIVQQAGYQRAFERLLDDVQALFFFDEKVAFDPKQHHSFSQVDQELDRIYTEQMRRVKDSVATLNLNTLQKTDGGKQHHVVVERLMNDADFKNIFAEKIREQIQETKQLTPWIPIDPASNLESCFKNPKVMEEITAQMLITIASNLLIDNHRAEILEEQKANLLATWQSFILLFYAFQRKEMMFRLNEMSMCQLSIIKTICKDGLDRGGIQGFIDDRLNDYMQGLHDRPDRMEAALYNLIAPPIAVKKQGVIPERMASGLFVEKRLERLSRNPKWCKKLSDYSFGEQHWKLAAIEMPREIAQSGIPSIKTAIKKELKDALPEKVPDILNRYAGINFNQWEEIAPQSIYQDKPNPGVGWVSDLIKSHVFPSIVETIGDEQFRSFELQAWDKDPIKLQTSDGSSQLLYQQSFSLTPKGQGETLCTFQTFVRLVKSCRPNSPARCYIRWLIQSDS